MSTRWWRNGEVLASPVIALDSPLARYGDGVFETVRVDNGVPRWFELHEERLTASAAAHELALVATPVLRTWVLGAAAALGSGTFAMRVLATPTEFDETTDIYVSAVPFAMPETGAGVSLLPVSVRHPGLSVTGKHTSWSWSRAALRQARRLGADDALLMRGDEVVESATATLIYRSNAHWFACGEDAGALASTTLRALRSHMPVPRRTTTLPELADADALVLLSSLRLATPVASLAGVDYNASALAAGELRRLLLAAP